MRAIAVWLLAMASGAVALGQQPQIEPLLARIASYQYSDSRESLAQFTQLVEDSLRTPPVLEQIEAALLKFLQSGATPAAKDFAFRELSLIATEKSVPVLKPMLVDPKTAEIARYALTRIPGSAADDALLKALPKTSGSVRTGIINSLGQRRVANASPALRQLLTTADAEAAAFALSDIADQPALDALSTARSKATAVTRQHITDALIRCAGRVENKSAAMKVYREIIGPQEPERIRISALAGLTSSDTATAIPLLTAELASKSPDMQAAAIRLLSELRDPKIGSLLIQHFPKLPTSSQITVLAALSDRGDPSAVPLFIASLNESGLRDAALTSLAYGLRGAEIDKAIVSALESATGKTKIELMKAAGERGVAPADFLIKTVAEKDPELQREALKALRNVAGPAQVPTLLEMLVKSTTASDRREATQTLASALRRSESASLDAVIATYKTTSAMPLRLALLEVIGQTSSDEALSLLRASLKDDSPEIARAAILALAEWPTPAPMNDLLPIAQTGVNPTLQVLALRGYLKLMALPSERSIAENARMLREAMQMAKQAGEKRTILSLLATFPSKESLQVAQAALKDQTVATEAKAAVDRINGLLKFQ